MHGRPTPEVSVVVPTWNSGPLLERQLSALAGQLDPPRWEILVADNGSTDHTSDVVAGWAARGLPVRLVDASRRRGASSARNQGVDAAVAPVLLFCDADDEVTPSWATEMLAGLARFDVVGGRADRKSLNPRGSWTYPKEVPKRHPFVSAASIAMRRQHFVDLGGFDESLVDGGEDIELCYRALRSGLTVGIVETAIYRSRARAGARAAFAQAARDGRGTVHLVQLHGHEIIPRRSPAVLLSKVGWLATRAPAAAVSGPYRTRWTYRLGHLTGLIQGWARFHTLAW
jgi:glycosyltransferase involved in cell wall biosynthesis